MLDQAAIDGGFEFHPALLIGSHAFLRISSQHDPEKVLDPGWHPVFR
jgi:hypothetical protein